MAEYPDYTHYDDGYTQAIASQRQSVQLTPDLASAVHAVYVESTGYGLSQETPQAFFVSNPVKMEDQAGLIKVGSVVKFRVQGRDSQGPFEVQRRYNEFLALNEQLNERWPGCYVPAIPEKQIFGDKEDGFIEERRQLLERFLRECAKYEFLIESKEFQVFARQPGEVQEALLELPSLTPQQILEKYKLNFPHI